MAIQMRVLLLALGVSAVLAQLEPDIQQVGRAASPAASAAPQTTQQPSQTFSRLLRDIAATAKPRSGQPITITTTTVQPPTTTTIASKLINSSQSSSSSSSQVSSATTTQVPNTAAESSSSSKYQYVKPITMKCQYNNQTYSIGQRWNDDCLQVCECVTNDDPINPAAISACRNRCPTFKDAPGENCRLERSRFDACCLDWQCNTEGKLPPPTTTVINTEQGQINVSTTDIRLLSSSQQQQPTTTAWIMSSTSSPPVTATPVAAATTTLAPPTTRPPAQQQPIKVIATTTTRVPPPTTTTMSTTVPTTTTIQASSQPKVSIATTTIVPATSSPPKSPQASGNRNPKEINNKVQFIDVTVTQATPTTTTVAHNTIQRSTTEAPKEEITPELFDLCIWYENPAKNPLETPKAYKLNTTWDEEPCNQSCKCVFQSEPRDPTSDVHIVKTINLKSGSEPTEIRCELPPACSSVAMKLAPSADCPNPKLVMPQETLEICACPRVECGPRRVLFPSMTSTTTTTTTAATPDLAPVGADGADDAPAVSSAAGCQAKGRLLLVGETYNDECHATCRCDEELSISCQPLVCPAEPPQDQECAQWILNPNFKVNSTENRCCPQYVCAHKQSSCHILGKELAHGQQVPEEIQPRMESDCAKQCFCNDGKLECQPMCAPLSELPPEELPCEPERAYKTSDECCPKWDCSITEEYAFEKFDVVPLNATAAEVTFTLPRFAVGQRGLAELNYTGLPAAEASATSTSDLPPVNAHWISKTKIKTLTGVFFNRVVKYHLTNLKPAHKYWFKLVVRFEGAASPLDEPLESPLQRAVMPPLERHEPAREDLAHLLTTTPARRNYPSSKPTPPTSGPPSSSPSTTSSTTTTTTTTTSTTTTEQPPPATPDQPSSTATSEREQPPSISRHPDTISEPPPLKPDISSYPPCQGKASDNGIDGSSLTMPWTDQMNGPIQRYAWHLLVGFSIMTILFTIVSFMYCKKSSCAIAPITPPSAYDNPSFTKLKSYNPQTLLLDETSHQNYSNDAILAQQKNMEVDKASPFHHHHQMNDFNHHNTRLI